MKTLILAPQPFYIDRGTPIDVDLLVRALSSRGNQADLVCFPGTEKRSYPGITVHEVPVPRRLSILPPGFSIGKVFADIRFLWFTLKLTRKNRFDLIHAGEEAVYIALLLRAIHGIPYVYDMDSSIAQQMVEQMPWLRPLAWLFNRLEALAISKAVAVAPVCEALAEIAQRWNAHHIEILHDISQLENLEQPPGHIFQEKWGIQRPVILYVGNLQPYQGVDLLLEAFDLAVEDGSQLDLVIVGGSDRSISNYRKKAVRLGIDGRTHFLGPWPNDRLGEILSDALILTSPRIKGVNTPMKVFPYLHSGRPVLLTDLPTHSQSIDSSIAVLAAPEPRPFAEGILKLERDPEFRERLAREARAFIEARHTLAAHQERVDRLYGYVEGVLAERPG